jgi:DNA-binding beta-propeller fold protein YncE
MYQDAGPEPRAAAVAAAGPDEVVPSLEETMSRKPLAILLAAAFMPMAGSAWAQLAVSANDNKVFWRNGVVANVANPPPDTVSVYDLSSFPPRKIGEVNAGATVAGSPQTVAVAPDESIALVTSGQKIDPADPTKLVADNLLNVIDLQARPPRVIATLNLGAGASGVSFNKAGTMALVANRNEGTVSVLGISGKTVRVLDKVTVGKPESLLSHVDFAADDKIALVTRNNEHQVAVLTVDGQTVKPAGRDISVGIRPYALAVHPSGRMALTANVGRGTGDNDTLSVIDTSRTPARVVNTVDVGTEVPEGLAISPDGRWAAVVAHGGSTKPSTSPFATTNGKLIIFRIEGTQLTRQSEAPIGRWSQGVVFSKDSKTVLVQNMVERNLMVFDFSAERLVDTGLRFELNGGGAALRTAR